MSWYHKAATHKTNTITRFTMTILSNSAPLQSFKKMFSPTCLQSQPGPVNQNRTRNNTIDLPLLSSYTSLCPSIPASPPVLPVCCGSDLDQKWACLTLCAVFYLLKSHLKPAQTSLNQPRSVQTSSLHLRRHSLAQPAMVGSTHHCLCPL